MLTMREALLFVTEFCLPRALSHEWKRALIDQLGLDSKLD
jgi:hypothetical protein